MGRRDPGTRRRTVCARVFIGHSTVFGASGGRFFKGNDGPEVGGLGGVIVALTLMVALRLTDRKERVGRSVPSVAVDPDSSDGRGDR